MLIEWQDGHLSTYSSEWLYRRRLDQGAITDRLDKVYTGVMDQPWSSKIPSEIMKCANYDDVGLLIYFHFEPNTVNLYSVEGFFC